VKLGVMHYEARSKRANLGALVTVLVAACGGAAPPAEGAERVSSSSSSGSSVSQDDGSATQGAEGEGDDGVKTTAAPVSAPLEPEYERFGFPSLARYWTAKEYRDASAILVKLAAEAPELMPQKEGPGRALFERFASKEAYVRTVKTERRAVDALLVNMSVGSFVLAYRGLVEEKKRKDLGSEWVELGTLFVATTPVAIEVLGAIFDEHPNDEAAVDTFALLRTAVVVETFMLMKASSMSQLVPQAEFFDRFSPHSGLVGSLLLPREKEFYSRATTKYIYMGGAPAKLAILKSFNEAALEPRVALHIKAHEKKSKEIWPGSR
jgi:hypothetical protein